MSSNSSNSNRNGVLLPPKPTTSTTTTNKEPRRSISTSSYFLRSEWDQGVDVLQDVIWNTKGLSEDQRQGLQQIQRLLLTKESRRQSYIPLELLQQVQQDEDEEQQQQQQDQDQGDPPQDATTSSCSRRKDPAAATSKKNKTTTTAQYLVQEYGGYAKSAVQVVRKKVKSVILANSFLRHLSKRSLLTRISSASASHGTTPTNKYAAALLPEFLELDANRQKQVAHMLSWDHLTNSITTFDVFCLNERTKGNALLFVGWALLESPDAQIAMSRIVQGMQEDEEEPQEDADDLHNKGYKFSEVISNWSTESMIQFLRAVQEEYHADNPYHNAMHAADVLQTTHVLWQRRLSATAAASLQDCSTLDGFALLLAAAVHDVGHPGTNNLYQVHKQTELAQIYNDQSVLENMHASKGFAVMRQHLDWWSNTRNDPQYIRLRRLMIPAILHTDMAQHFELVAEVKGLLRCNDDNDNDNDNNMNVDKYLYYILHLADISNPCKARYLATQWTDRILQECFAQGDAEIRQGLLPISPLCDRNTTAKAASQVGFLQYIVIPSVQVLTELCSVDEWVDQLQVNLAYWKERQEKEQSTSLISTSNSSQETAATVSETEADEDEA